MPSIPKPVLKPVRHACLALAFSALMAGCGGFCGELRPDKPGQSNAINEALKRGYAGISHDSGHQAKSWETQWASDRVALELWAHKVLPRVAGVGEQLATALYGRAPAYSYFSGCSNGGRLGLQAGGNPDKYQSYQCVDDPAPPGA